MNATTVLGVLVSALALLVVVLVTGWMWTCWTMKKRKKVNFG